MNKKLVLILIIFFSLASLGLVFAFGVKPTVLEDKVNPSDVTLYKLKQEKNNIARKILKDELVNCRDFFEEVNKEFRLYKNINKKISTPKKDEKFYLYYMLSPKNSIRYDVFVKLNIPGEKDVILELKENEKEKVYKTKYFEFKLLKNTHQFIRNENVVYLEIKVIKDIKSDDFSKEASATLEFIVDKLTNISKKVSLTTNINISD